MARSEDDDARFRLMFERSADAILLLDTSINKFVEYNQATLDMLRCTREELSALHPSELSPPRQPDGTDSYAAANARIAAAVSAGSLRFEWIHRSPHRGDFPVEVLLTPIQMGTAPMLLVVWRDITERKRSEEALRQAQKLESLGILAGGVAHDFNNLLAAIRSRASLARQALPDGEKVRQELEFLERAVDRAADLSAQMLAYSGERALTLEPIDLGRAVGEMSDLLSAASPTVKLEVSAPRSGVVVEANRAQLQQVIMNLVTNAAEASAPGGAVQLRVHRTQLSAEEVERDFPGQSLRPGPVALLEVEDHGTGIAPSMVSRIFDPFFSTKGPGRGLGLSALAGIVRGCHGAVRIESKEGRGTTFFVALPVSSRPASRDLAPPPRATPGLGSGEVLLADDQPNVRSSTRALLESFGFTVYDVVDGQAAVDVFTESPTRFRWVLMDLTMPRLDGHRAFVALRAVNPAVPVVLTSGWAEADVAERFRTNPPDGLLRKPYRASDLEQLLRKLGLME